MLAPRQLPRPGSPLARARTPPGTRTHLWKGPQQLKELCWWLTMVGQHHGLPLRLGSLSPDMRVLPNSLGLWHHF